MKRRDKEVFCYNWAQVCRDNRVRDSYIKQRKSDGTERCDIEGCRFFDREPLIWNDKPLKLIVDHISGNWKDSTINNLRLVCPNCSFQLHTHGGGNKGRLIFEGPTGYIVIGKCGRQEKYILPEGAQVALKGYSPTISVTKYKT